MNNKRHSAIGTLELRLREIGPIYARRTTLRSLATSEHSSFMQLEFAN